MRRFFIEQDAVSVGSNTQLGREESHHLRDVLRLRCGNQVRVFCNGREFTAIVKDTQGEQVSVLVTGECDAVTPPRITVHAVVPLLKGGHTEEIAHRLTELGVASIGLFRAQRAVVELTPARTDRMRRVVMAACKQCRRADLPDVTTHASLCQAIDAHGLAPPWSIILYEQEHALRLTEALARTGLGEAPPQSQETILLASGPEGGFTDDEIAAVQDRTTLVGMGPRILRAETAPVVAVAAILALAREI